MPAHQETVDRAGGSVGGHGVTLPLGMPGVVTVSLDGQYVWSFRPLRDGSHGLRSTATAWPEALRNRLDGTSRVVVRDHASGRVYVDEEITFGSGPGRVRVVDQHGHPLAVNKVGNLTRVFAETDEHVRHSILTGTARVLADLNEHGRVDAFLNYGCLLGAVREGRMIGHDCDTDVCYLSQHTDPVDVILESYRLERVMTRRGWRTVRMSGGDFKVVLPLVDGRTCYVDVFVAFTVGDTYYQLGNRSGYLPREAITPTSTIVLHGVEMPAPRDPEAMLAFIYGPDWRVPDPSFKFSDPVRGARRLDGWLRGFRTELADWDRLYQGRRSKDIPRRASGFARWTAERIRSHHGVVDLGCGTGRDSTWFGRQGHPVLAYDLSPRARSLTRRALRRNGHPSPVRRLMLNELRTVAVTGLEIATASGRWHLYARHVLGALNDDARRNLWRLARTALTDGGSLFLEFSSPHPDAPARPQHLVRRLDPAVVAREVAQYGGHVVERWDGAGHDMFDQHDPATCRMQVAFT